MIDNGSNKGLKIVFCGCRHADQAREVEQFKIIQSFASDLLGNIKDFDPEFSRTVDAHFWDLV